MCVVERVHVKGTRGRTNEMCVVEMGHVKRMKGRTSQMRVQTRRMKGEEGGGQMFVVNRL